MNEIITRIEKLKPKPTEAITLFYNFEDINMETICNLINYLGKKFPENTVIAIPDKESLENCSKDVLENIVSMISEIIETL